MIKMELKILKSKEAKEILAMIKLQWDAEPKLDYAFLLSERERVYVVNRDILMIDISKVRMNSLGIYFGEWKNNELRLSIEGSQIIGPFAKKNVVELDEEEMLKWFKGEDFKKETTAQGFVIVKHKNDFLGCGKIKEGTLLNFVPKVRRVKELII